MRLGLAFRAFFQVLRDERAAEKIGKLMAPPEAAKPSAEPLRLLAILQRDGRLMDFLAEDIKAYSDVQVGAAVRDIHRDCKAALAKYVELGPVLDEEEGESVEITAGFDPTSVQLTGNVKGGPPFLGKLVHRGWRAKEIRLPAPVAGADDMIIAPAEVEIA